MTLKRSLSAPEPGSVTIFGEKVFADIKDPEMRSFWIAWEEPTPNGKCLHKAQKHRKQE